MRVKLFKKCEEAHFTLLQCPDFLFVLMGSITIIVIIATYIVTRKYANPEIVVSSVSAVTVIIFTIGNIIIKSVKQLAEANYMKTEFVSIASHQLRAPLAAIKWAIESLNNKNTLKNPDKEREYLDIIKDNNKRMVRLVNDLLNVSRIEQGGFIIKKEKCNISALVKKSINDFTPLAQAKNIQISFAGDSSIIIPADKQKIKIVIDNLIGNAIHYTKGHGIINISIKNRKKSIKFHIKDNGIGIPYMDQSSIFKKFFRSANVLERQTQGTGLGLYISKAIIEKHNGKIWFHSKINKGTTFYFKIPKNQN